MHLIFIVKKVILWYIVCNKGDLPYEKEILKILILIIIELTIGITIFVIKHKIYNKIEENWIIKISPNYLYQQPNTVYLYEDSYIITNCFTTSNW